MKTVQEMRNSLTTGKLLSCFNAPFWTPYLANNTHYDNYFARKYKSFIYYDQEDDDSIDTVTTNFIKAVYDHLLVNEKRYTELFRINVVPDDENYNILENYYLSETYSGTNNSSGASTIGQRTDITNNLYGEQNTANQNRVTAFNTNTESNSNSVAGKTGTKNDISQYTKGQESSTGQSNSTDSHTMIRHGAIGTQTADQVLQIHDKYWSDMTAFYDFVFREISKELLLIGG